MSDHEIDRLRMAITAALGEATGIANVPGEKFVEALAKRVTVKPEPPPKKVWSVSEETAMQFVGGKSVTGNTNIALNSIAHLVIRERPDLVAAEWERRYRSGYVFANSTDAVTIHRACLFPELDP